MMLPTVAAMSRQSRRVAGVASSDDWATRAGAAGVILADRLNTSTKLVGGSITASNWLLNNSTADHVSLDTSVYPTGSTGSFKFDVLNTDTTGSGDVGVYFGNITTFGNGDTFWSSVRVKAPPQMAYAPWDFDSGSGGGSHKICILSHSSGSNQINEVVVQTNYTGNSITGYWQDGASSSVLPDIGASTACSGSDFIWQPSVDRGVNPLTGNDPDTGSAWSSCAQARARYGGLYSAKSLAMWQRGLGDPLSGAVRQVPDEWITLIQRIVIGTFGTGSSRWTLWAAREGQAPELIHDKTSITLGAGPEYNTFWLLPYTSNRFAGGRKISSRTSNITGVDLYVCGLETPTGDGTLEYNATTGRFRWAGASESFGTARGYSAANNLLTLNVSSGTAAESYVVLKVNPAALPSSGTVTDTVTIASGRPDTQVNYADAIISTQIINAPGGYAPAG